MEVHITPISVYVKVFALLVVLLFVTVGVSYLHLGILNLAVAMAVAIVKAVFVILYFMHLKDSSKLTQVWAMAGVIFLFTLFVLSMSDYLSRM